MTNKNEKKAQFSRFLAKAEYVMHVHVCACLGLCIYKREQQFNFSHGWMTIKVLARKTSYMNERSLSLTDSLGSCFPNYKTVSKAKK